MKVQASLLVAAGLIALSACTHKSDECAENSQCAGHERCNTDLGVCIAKECTSDSTCGANAVCGDDDVCLPTTGCATACRADQLCIAGSCENQYASIEIVQPQGQTNNGLIVANLVLAPGGRPQDVPELSFNLTGPGAATGAMQRTDAGTYETRWAGSPEGEYQLVVTAGTGGPSATSSFTVDLTDPTFTLTVPNAAPRRDGGPEAAGEKDPAMNGPKVYRRDEKVTLTVTSPDPVDPASVKLIVTGFRESGTPAALDPIDVTAGTSCGTPYCGTVEVDLALPELLAPRGIFKAKVTGKDLAGNEASEEADIQVTRVKWIYPVAGREFHASPAITSKGWVIAGTRGTTSTGEVYALNPDGTREWGVDAGGGVVSSPVVGAPDGGMEPIYVAVNTSGSAAALRFIDSLDGATLATPCTHSALIEASPALLSLKADNDSAAREGIAYVTASGAGALVLARPLAASPCFSATGAGTLLWPGAVVTDGTLTFHVDGSQSLRPHEMEPTTPDVTPLPSVGVAQKSPMLAIDNGVVVGGGETSAANGSFFAIPVGGSTVSWRSDAVSYPWGVSIGTGSVVFSGLNDERMGSATVGGPTSVASVANTGLGVTQNAPSWGADGLAYSGTQLGVFQVWNPSTLNLIWSDSGLDNIKAAVALDCARQSNGTKIPGRPGVAYVAGTNGQLRAYIVDARGIDTTAPWPKYQHDPRNTGNSQTDLSQFACP